MAGCATSASLTLDLAVQRATVVMAYPGTLWSVSRPEAFTPNRVYGDHCVMERPLASIPSATDADSIPVLVDIVPPGTAQDQHPDIPDRLKLGEDLPSPELIRAALRLWRDIRETGVVPEEHCLYHIVWCILSLADHRVLSSPVLAALEEQIRAAADGDKDTLERQLEGEADRIVAGTLRECGEADMALLYETNRVEFHRLYDAGSKRSFDPAETGNAKTSAVIRSRQVGRLSLRMITGGLTRYWARLAHTLNGR